MATILAVYWVCTDCLMGIANGDLSGVDYYLSGVEAEERKAAIEAGMARLGWVAPTGEEDEVRSSTNCPCCNGTIGAFGKVHRVVSMD